MRLDCAVSSDRVVTCSTVSSPCGVCSSVWAFCSWKARPCSSPTPSSHRPHPSASPPEPRILLRQPRNRITQKPAGRKASHRCEDRTSRCLSHAYIDTIYKVMSVHDHDYNLFVYLVTHAWTAPPVPSTSRHPSPTLSALGTPTSRINSTRQRTYRFRVFSINHLSGRTSVIYRSQYTIRRQGSPQPRLPWCLPSLAVPSHAFFGRQMR